MIQQQVRPWGVLDDRALDVMAEIQRESFVPDAYRALAYADIDIPIGEDSCMLHPKLVGHLLQALQVHPGDKALEIGTGTGYVSTCLSRLGARVTSIEIDPTLASAARERLAALKVKNVDIREADGLAMPMPGAPYDAIAVTGSMPTEAALPMLQAQLAIGGRLFCVLGEAPVMTCLRIRRMSKDDFRREALFETFVPPLKNVAEPAGFEF
ncbi:protein-L-isoaspartate O-methyltransferase [Thiocystis violacea]|nr:protein-L-isoaspartate O-methyltransferase [Thiocystis violacea]